MSWKQEKVSMPMTSAGILGMGADVKISGIEMDPRNVIIATLVLVIIVKVAGIVISKGAGI